MAWAETARIPMRDVQFLLDLLEQGQKQSKKPPPPAPRGAKRVPVMN